MRTRVGTSPYPSLSLTLPPQNPTFNLLLNHHLPHNLLPPRFTDLPKKARGSGTGLEELTVLRSMAVGKRLAADAAAESSSAAAPAGGGGEQQPPPPEDEAELLFRASRDAGERVAWLNKFLSALEAFEAFLRAEGLLEPRPPTPRVPLPGGGVLSIVADAILSADDVAKKLVFEWQSALSGSGAGGGGFSKLFGLSAEKAATTALLAAALRNAGTAAAAAATAASSASNRAGGASDDGGGGGNGGNGEEGSSSSGAALVNAASLFRRAAGLYDAIAAAGDAAAAASASSASSLPPLAELRPSAARALSCLCLADAQALAAAKAKSPGARGSAWAAAEVTVARSSAPNVAMFSRISESAGIA